MRRPELRVYMSKVMRQHQVDRHTFLARNKEVLGRGSIVVTKLMKTETLWRGALERAIVCFEPNAVLAHKLASGGYITHGRIEKVLYNAPAEPMEAVPDDLADSWSSWPEQMLVGDNGKIMTDPVALREM